MDKCESRFPRVMIAAPSSGSGKTVVSCALLQLFKLQGRVAAFKCGPDYIDPMFHRTVLGTASRNLDSWLAPPETVRGLLLHHAAKERADVCLMEGVMGYYDGAGGTACGSSYEISVITQTPVILLVNASGAGLSLAAQIRGFLEFRKDQRIRGVILNRCSEKVFAFLRPALEEELGLAVLGYIPVREEIHFPGRHLGLLMPEEIAGLRRRIEDFARSMEKTMDVRRILEIAREAPPLAGEETKDTVCCWGSLQAGQGKEPVRIGVARDEAFCFYYEDNLDLLQEYGALLVYFSPLHDAGLPEGLDGLYLGGGYPELHAGELSKNRPMLSAVAEAAAGGMPVLAECGAFMYLHEQMEDVEGKFWPMAGVIPGKAFRRGHLVRFGYCELTAREETVLGPAGIRLRAHEFHYWDSDADTGQAAFSAEKPDRTTCLAQKPGQAAFSAEKPNRTTCLAQKPGRPDKWNCFYSRGNVLAGFPHLYFPGAPQAAEHFTEACRRWEGFPAGKAD